MNGVIGMIEVLEASQLQPDQRDMAKIVRESAFALLAIVDDVLDFSKIEAGQFTIDHAPLDVEAVVEGRRASR
jgi:signal transduction histidine kinase